MPPAAMAGWGKTGEREVPPLELAGQVRAVPPTVVAGQGERGSRQQWLRDRLGLHKTSYLHVIFEDTMIFEDSKDLLTHSFHF